MNIFLIVMNLICISALATGLALVIILKYGENKKVYTCPRYVHILLGIFCIIGSPIIFTVMLFDWIGGLINWLKEEVTV